MGCIGVDWLGCHVYPHHFVAHVVVADADWSHPMKDCNVWVMEAIMADAEAEEVAITVITTAINH
jgi:hypothetical protein